MKLKELLKNVKVEKIINEKDVDIDGISYNSKTIKNGEIFVCLKGEYSDGHDFAKMAQQNGASALFCEKEIPEIDIPQVIVKSTRHQIADIAAAFYNYPSKKIKLIGVTGTNGKTTVTHLIQRIVEDANHRCALIGTLGYKLSGSDSYHDAKHTTPQAPELQKTLEMICEKNIDYVAMEVSSHALDQNRVGGCDFDGAVFTNLTQDHLDYHITMNNYFEAKALLFRGLKQGGFAVINNDDEYAQKFQSVVANGVKIYTYGIKKEADIMASNIDFSIHGAKFECKILEQKRTVNLQMNGMFSVYNSLAHCYKEAIEELESITDRKYNTINIIGGGCQNELLNEMIAKITSKKVIAGPVEATALGNILSQLLADGVIKDLSEGRKLIKKSFEIKKY